MKNILRKSILGIPVGLIASVLMVTSAAAAWIISQTVTFHAETAYLGPIDFILDENLNTVVEIDVLPTGLRCFGAPTKSNHGVIFSAAMAGATPGDTCHYELTVNNLGNVPVYVAPFEHSLGAEFELTEYSCGKLIPAFSSDQTLEFELRLTDQAEPHTYYDDTKLIPNYEINPPACP